MGDVRSLLTPERVADAQVRIHRLVGELRRVILGREQTIDEVKEDAQWVRQQKS